MNGFAQHDPSFLSQIVDWYRRFVERLSRVQEFEETGSQELCHLASDIGVSVEELARLGRMPESMIDLLERRLAVLGLSSAEIAKAAPELVLELRRSCSHCLVSGACTRDLASRPHDPAWKDYCPNAGRIEGLA